MDRPHWHYKTAWVDLDLAGAPGRLELQHGLLSGVALNLLCGQRWTDDAAVQWFQRLAVVGTAVHCGASGITSYVICVDAGLHIMA